MATYKNVLETPSASCAGTMEAIVFEKAEFGPDTPATLIKTTQDWGIEVKWELHGDDTPLINGEFRVRAFLERMGPGDDKVIPMGAQDYVAVSTGDLQPPDPADPNPQLNALLYKTKIEVPKVPEPTSVPAGTYKVTTIVQLYRGSLATSKPMMVAGFLEGPMIEIYEPA